ncbi:hypothetical protein [Candidatus Amarobacter glycogenicus]|uniref:hypothetical protein n=1 Tax=Candidatus Amarobacter glycogenicus TaxID=3140699 RepID=UPI003134CE39|nr:hypothetical protein [Dehalococcoidia bacterium]
MKSPGVTVRPLINMSDRHGFNEVFFEDVRVPANQVVGEVNRGWYHMAVALDFERSGIQSYAGGAAASNGSRGWRRNTLSRSNGGRRSVTNWRTARSISRWVRTRRTGWGRCRLKAVCRTTRRVLRSCSGAKWARIPLTGMHLLDARAARRTGRSTRSSTRRRLHESVSGTVAAGTSEIQRGIIATRGLGLPRG